MVRLLLLLIVVAVASALGVVYAKYRTRMLFAEVQRLQQAIDAYEGEWWQLQAEQKTWAENGRIERFASSRLGMVLPPRDSIRYVQP